MHKFNLKSEEVNLIKSSFQLINNPGLPENFYHCLFELAPLVKPMFKSDMHIQKKHFSTIFSSAVENIEHKEILGPILFELGKRHKDYGVKESHFSIVKSALLLTISSQLKDNHSEKTEKAWANYYDEMAAIVIKGLHS